MSEKSWLNGDGATNFKDRRPTPSASAGAAVAWCYQWRMKMFETSEDAWRLALSFTKPTSDQRNEYRNIVPLYLSSGMPSREEIAKAIYDQDPHFEAGEYVDGFPVSPGGCLSWQQAKDRDAEFADNKIFLPITKFAYDCADAFLSLSPAAVTSPERGS